jgi:DNA-binding transcriptional LysR family regulator
MDTRQLRTFLTIVDMQSFTRAARRLGLSQSAISQQLGALEKQLGVQLLIRSGTGARTTSAGELAVQYARQILTRVDEVQRMLADYDSSPRGVLRIGAGGAVCHHLLPEVLSEFRDAFPRVELQVRSGHSALTVERLLAGELDLGIVTVPVSQPRLRVTNLGRDELVAIVAPAHPWALRQRVQPGDFGGEPLLVYERRSRSYHLIERTLFEAGVFPQIAMELDYMDAVKAMARAGLGVAIVPRWAVTREITAAELVALPIGKSGLTRAWAVAVPEQSHRSTPLKAFVHSCTVRLPAMLAV